MAGLNLTFLSLSSSYKPYLATGGYQAFLKENRNRFHEHAKAYVYGTPVLKPLGLRKNGEHFVTSLTHVYTRLPNCSYAGLSRPLYLRLPAVAGLFWRRLGCGRHRDGKPVRWDRHLNLVPSEKILGLCHISRTALPAGIENDKPGKSNLH